MKPTLSTEERNKISLGLIYLRQALRSLPDVADEQRQGLPGLIGDLEARLAAPPSGGPDPFEAGDGWHGHTLDFAAPVAGDCRSSYTGTCCRAKADGPEDEKAMAHEACGSPGRWPAAGTPEGAEYGPGWEC